MSKIQVTGTVEETRAALAAGAFIVATHGGPAVHADETVAAALIAASHPDCTLAVFRIERDDREGLAWARQHCRYVFDVGGKPLDSDRAVVLDHHYLGLAGRPAGVAWAKENGRNPGQMSGKDYQGAVDAVGAGATPYSSAGLVLDHLMMNRGHAFPQWVTDVVRHVDATDNGIQGVEHGVEGLPPSLGLAVHKASPIPRSGGQVSRGRTNAHFQQLVELGLAALQGGSMEEWARGLRDLVEEAEDGRQASWDRVTPLVKGASKVLVLDQYEASALDVIGNMATESQVLYLIFPSGGQWMVQQAPTGPMPCFKGKKPLPEKWAGRRDKDLAEITGVADSIFCHTGRFICAANSREGAIALAKLAVEEA